MDRASQGARRSKGPTALDPEGPHSAGGWRERLAALICPDGRIADLLRECELHRAAAEGRWEDLYLLHAGPAISGKNGFEIAMRSPIAFILVEHMARMLDTLGAENWVEVGVTHKRLGALTLTVQRQLGETPAQKIKRLEAEIEVLQSTDGAERVQLGADGEAGSTGTNPASSPTPNPKASHDQ